eukprot:3606031-Rhodomonas_salina.3
MWFLEFLALDFLGVHSLLTPSLSPHTACSRSLTSELGETRDQESEFSTVRVFPRPGFCSSTVTRENQEEIPVWLLTP